MHAIIAPLVKNETVESHQCSLQASEIAIGPAFYPFRCGSISLNAGEEEERISS